MTANPVLLQRKYARVIELFAEKAKISNSSALDFFYHSQERELLRDGVSDLHCMSDDYIAEDLLEEYRNKNDTGKRLGLAKGQLQTSNVDLRKTEGTEG